MLISTVLVTFVILLTDVASPEDRSTKGVAEQYLSAILDGDRERALGLIRLEVLCSGAGMEEEVDKHLALFASAAVRHVTITVRDIGGGVAYNPGTEAADIQFEYKRLVWSWPSSRCSGSDCCERLGWKSERWLRPARIA